MTDPTGAPPPLGIEAVEWLAVGGGQLTVRVTGRWRRRRPTWSGQPLLVIEAEGRRHRFPAMPEPPSLTGTAPGTWRMSFSVPVWLGPYLAGRAWLQLGAVILPLPMAVEAAGPPESEEPSAPRQPPTPAPAADPSTLVERRLRSAELAVQAARGRADEAEQLAAELSGRIERLERELATARTQPDRLNALLRERERAWRSAEQREHAERMMREELEDRLAELDRQLRESAAALEGVGAIDERILELEAELDLARRRADEADQLAAAARIARERAEQRAAKVRRVRDVSDELAVAERLPPARPRRSVRPAASPGAMEALRREREVLAARGQEVARMRLRSEQAFAAIDQVREELRHLRSGLEDPPAGDAVDPSRFDEALSRLREPAVPEPPISAPGAGEAPRAWFLEAVRRLASTDPTAAGRLLVAVARAAAPQSPLDEPEAARLATLLGAGPIRRAIRRVRPGTRRHRELLEALRSTLSSPFTLQELLEAGVRVEAELGLRLVSAMIDPGWTRGHRFTVAHQEPGSTVPAVHLHVQDGAALSVTRVSPLGAVATTVVCPGESLLPLLAGASRGDAVIRGDGVPVALLREWVNRAQSG